MCGCGLCVWVVCVCLSDDECEAIYHGVAQVSDVIWLRLNACRVRAGARMCVRVCVWVCCLFVVCLKCLFVFVSACAMCVYVLMVACVRACVCVSKHAFVS